MADRVRWLADYVADDWRRQSAMAREDDRRRVERTVWALDVTNARRWKRIRARAYQRAHAVIEAHKRQRLTGRAKAERDAFVISWLRLASFDLRRDMIAALALGSGYLRKLCAGHLEAQRLPDQPATLRSLRLRQARAQRQA